MDRMVLARPGVCVGGGGGGGRIFLLQSKNVKMKRKKVSVLSESDERRSTAHQCVCVWGGRGGDPSGPLRRELSSASELEPKLK